MEDPLELPQYDPPNIGFMMLGFLIYVANDEGRLVPAGMVEAQDTRVMGNHEFIEEYFVQEFPFEEID